MLWLDVRDNYYRLTIYINAKRDKLLNKSGTLKFESIIITSIRIKYFTLKTKRFVHHNLIRNILIFLSFYKEIYW